MNRKFRINGEAVAASQEGALMIELFLNDNYRFRRNVLNGKVEFMTLPEGEGASWRPLTQEALNSIILKADHGKRQPHCQDQDVCAVRGSACV